MLTTKNLNFGFKRVFKINSITWIYSDGNMLLVEVEADDDMIRLREPTCRESEKILEKIKDI